MWDQLNPPISEAGGAKFWFHGMRNCFITVAEHDLLLPRSLSKRLVNHARSNDVTEGYAADWTAGQLREPAQRIADRIESLTDKLTVKKLKATDASTERLVKQAEAAFRVMPDTIPMFDHFRPAAWLIRNTKLLEKKSAPIGKTLDRAEKIFKTYNDLLL